MVAASDHGHSRGQVANHIVSGRTHTLLLGVQSIIFFDNLFGGSQCDLVGSVKRLRVLGAKIQSSCFLRETFDQTFITIYFEYGLYAIVQNLKD